MVYSHDPLPTRVGVIDVSSTDALSENRLQPRVRSDTMALMPPHSRIIRFYLGSAPDHDGRMIGDIWQWSRPELNASPSAFNWLFPMPDGSFLRGGLPLYPEDVVHFKSHPTLQANARRSFAWFAGIIGLSIDGDGAIAKGPSFAENFDPENPLTIRRIRRVLRFLEVIGFDDDTKKLLAWLVAEGASEQSRLPRSFVAHWRKKIEPAKTADSGDAITQTERDE